tara:strand:+ start:141 stop:1523 length:1383 start_codon:yes stop_codon:yes gene_type:complete
MKKSPARNANLKNQASLVLEKINNSIDVDKRLYKEDIEVSIVHCKMLIKSKIITPKEGKAIILGLQKIYKEISINKVKFNSKLEDIHMNIESMLFKKIGNVAGKLHTGRSRNDQVVTDLKIWIKRSIFNIEKELQLFQKILLKQAKKNVNTIMPGYTHLQIAQAVSLGHHLMAYVEMIGRDRERINNCLDRLNECPLGAAALAGTSFTINRSYTSKLLGFKKPTANSIDSVSDRDFVIEFMFSLSLISVHLSRLAEEIVLWSSQHFNFIELPDELSTGSSILPQKKNPDGAELVRGKTSIIISNLNAMLNIIKNLPLSYNKDMQEDKKLTFEVYDNTLVSIRILNEIMKKIKINKKQMLKALNDSNAVAIDLADWLVKEIGYTFREAYNLTGKIIKYSSKKEKLLSDLTINELKKFEKKITNNVFGVIKAQNSIKNKKSIGGTAPENVKLAIKKAELKYL